MIADGRLKPGAVGMNCVMYDSSEPKAIEECYKVGDASGNILKLSITSDEKFIDDLTGQLLDPALCRAARKKEMDFVREKGLWIKRTIKECWSRTGAPPVTVRWVETNKGDDEHPNVRSRLVAKEFNNKKCDDLFAGTPPVEAMRAIISMAASLTPLAFVEMIINSKSILSGTSVKASKDLFTLVPLAPSIFKPFFFILVETKFIN